MAAEAAEQSPDLIEIIDVDQDVKFLSSTPISNRGLTKSTAISVEQYSKSKETRSLNFIDEDDELQVLESLPPSSTSFSKNKRRLKRLFAGGTNIELGESSNSAAKQSPNKFVCSICVEEKDASDFFREKGCTHSYCTDCISRYVASKLHDNVTSIKCPVSECDERLEAGHCRSILPKEVFDRWGNALCEALILGIDKFHCPYKDCSAMLINDDAKLEESECPYCYRMFCVQCKVPWHADLSCQDYQKADACRVRYEQFKRFDTVDDYSDHHYVTSKFTPAKDWAKRIQDEWKILEKDLPETIFVRVYEERMDLLRAVILGAEGTPYHDGLFFFDVMFPSTYPNTPPQVYYQSHGHRLNPNLYTNGYVCLSLLNTWQGKAEQMWQPKRSTMLQVLVSIQGLVLNADPYFNEPGYESYRGTAQGKMCSNKYSEDAFILSLKTMSYNIRNPPKHFEDLVGGHFMTRAEYILEKCRGYMDGAQVGSSVKGGENKAGSGCSERFKKTLYMYLDKYLSQDFRNIGIKASIPSRREQSN